ncbi:TlpA family protein disulfide reductase [Bacteroides timonensis]|uniref:TlpA family protein disulfide reductase n=1 Tax=Bacteroides timonensis TaxID=1470345 RepID=UPI0004B1A28B|nr:TlpA disulfide reductase family protein [Bacteroides timonensis]
MKSIAITYFVLIAVCVGLQAKKVVKAPYFMATNTRSLEIEKVTLGKDTTWLEVKIYNRPGEGVRIDSTAVLCVADKKYALYNSEGFSQKEEWTRLPASGEMAATLKFAPLPQETESFDFIEMPGSDEGWNVYGVRLDGKKPQVDVPEEVLHQQLDYTLPLPIPELKADKAIVKGRLLGYKPEYGVKLLFYNSAWFFFDFFGKQIEVAEDGTFNYETDVLLPCGCTLWVAGCQFYLFIVPGGELDITMNLPAIFWLRSHLFGEKQRTDEETQVWYQGDYAGLNTELLRIGGMMRVGSNDNFCADICGMTPLAFKKYIFKQYKTLRKQLEGEKNLSQASRTYAGVNLDMSLFSCIYNYKSNLSYAPMISGKKGVKRADMTVDSTSYFKEILELDVLHSPELKYYNYYPDFVRTATSSLRDRFVQDPLWVDIMLGMRAASNLSRQLPLSPKERLTLDSIHTPAIRQLFLKKNADIEARLEAVKNKTGYTACLLDTAVTADSLLAVVTRPYRGKVVLIDMWNTWCGPCMRAMNSLKPVKEELKDVVYIYIADESSPEGKWKITIPDIHGIHYRITNEQSSALGKLYEYPGIPTYFVIDREGKLSYKVTGFPGAEVMKEELLKAGE